MQCGGGRALPREHRVHVHLQRTAQRGKVLVAQRQLAPLGARNGGYRHAGLLGQVLQSPTQRLARIAQAAPKGFTVQQRAARGAGLPLLFLAKLHGLSILFEFVFGMPSALCAGPVGERCHVGQPGASAQTALNFAPPPSCVIASLGRCGAAAGRFHRTR